MQISDMHVKDSSSCNYLVESFKEAQNYHPDFVVYTGDFVSYKDHTQIERLKVVMTSAVKGSLGTWAVLEIMTTDGGGHSQKLPMQS